jgi:hypothetical protein
VLADQEPTNYTVRRYPHQVQSVPDLTGGNGTTCNLALPLHCRWLAQGPGSPTLMHRVRGGKTYTGIALQACPHKTLAMGAQAVHL